MCLRGAKDSIAAVRADADTDDRPAARDDLPSYLREFLDAYLSIRHRDDPMTGCTVAALSGDAGRRPRELQAAFATGIDGMATALAHTAERNYPALATMVGALVLARAVEDADPAMSEAILHTTKNALIEQAGAVAR